MSSTDGETGVLTLEQEIDKTNPCLAYLTGQGTTSNIFSLRLTQSDSQCWACAVGAYRGSVTSSQVPGLRNLNTEEQSINHASPKKLGNGSAH